MTHIPGAIPPRAESAERAVWLPSTLTFGWWLPRSGAVRGYGRAQIAAPIIVVLVCAGLMFASILGASENAIFGYLAGILLLICMLIVLSMPFGPPMPIGVDPLGATVISPWRWMPPVTANGILRFSAHRVRQRAVLAIWINNDRPLVMIPLAANGRSSLTHGQLSALISLIEASPRRGLEARANRDLKNPVGPPVAQADAIAVLTHQREWTMSGAPGPSPADAFLQESLRTRR